MQTLLPAPHSDPHADSQPLVSGNMIFSIADALKYGSVPLIRKYGLDEVNKAAWYPQQYLLGFLNELEQLHQSISLVNAGKRLPELIQFPEYVDSVFDALLAMHGYYQRLHQHDMHGWHCMVINSTEIVCMSNTPYPCDFEYGLLLRLLERFSGSQLFTITHDHTNDCRKQGDKFCSYRLLWDDSEILTKFRQ